jgi:uncharacterized protein YbjT (DUF2867 family)
MKHVAIVGATGKLAPVVIEALLQQGFQLRALVRNPQKAQDILPPAVEILEADLQDIDSLRRGLEGMDYLYLNLSTPTPDASFQPEYDGIRNLLAACEGLPIERIFKISGLGAFRPDFAKGKTFFANEIRNQGHELLKASGIPYTLFHPSWFMDGLEMMFKQGEVVNGFKPIKHPIYWIAGRDYAWMVAQAMLAPRPGNHDYAVQGPEAVSMHDALLRFSQTYDPPLKVRETPIGMLKFMGLFSKTFKMLGLMGDYFRDFEEKFVAQSTWDELYKPSIRIEDFREKEVARAL